MESKLRESAWGSSMKYKIPDNKEQQLYDFYMITLLSNKVPQKGVERDDESSQLEYVLHEIKSELLPKLKSNLLQAVFFSITCEIRHIRELNAVDKVSFLLAKNLGRRATKSFKKFMSNFSENDILPMKDMPSHPRTNDEIKDTDNREYLNAYQSALASGDKTTFVEMAQFCFKNARWDYNYGGDPWAGICNGWLRLREAKNLNEMQVWIDHIYDLQHNTGSVFTKVKSYYGKNQFKWLSDALDHKKVIENPYEMIDYVSPSMRTIAVRTLKSRTGVSLSKFKDEEIANAKRHFGEATLEAAESIWKSNFGTPEQRVARMCLNHVMNHESAVTFDKPSSGMVLNIKDVAKSLYNWVTKGEEEEDKLEIDYFTTVKYIKNDYDFINGKLNLDSAGMARMREISSVPYKALTKLQETIKSSILDLTELRELASEFSKLTNFFLFVSRNIVVNLEKIYSPVPKAALQDLEGIWGTIHPLHSPNSVGSINYITMIRTFVIWVYSIKGKDGSRAINDVELENSKRIFVKFLETKHLSSYLSDQYGTELFYSRVENEINIIKNIVSATQNLITMDIVSRTPSGNPYTNSFYTSTLMPVYQELRQKFPGMKPSEINERIRFLTGYPKSWCICIGKYFVLIDITNDRGYHEKLYSILSDPKPPFETIRKEHHIIESSWGSSMRYKVPRDKEEQLYDFYMMTFLSNKTPQKGVDRDDEESQLEYVLHEIKSELLPKLKSNLLQAVFFSIACEFRHVEDANPKVKMSEEIALDMNQKYKEIFQKFISEMHKRNVSWLPPHRRTKEELETGPYDDYHNAYQAALSSGGNKLEFIRLAQYCFDNANWNVQFGGKAWSDICNGWMNLYQAKDLNNMQVWIDHIYDLQHNTGSVFNKVQSYTKDGTFAWLKQALDHKREIENPYELIDYCSQQMKSIAIRTLKSRTGTSFRQFQKDYIQNAKRFFDNGFLSKSELLWNETPGTKEQLLARMCLNYLYLKDEDYTNAIKNSDPQKSDLFDIVNSLYRYLQELKTTRSILDDENSKNKKDDREPNNKKDDREPNIEEIHKITVNDLNFIRGESDQLLSIPKNIVEKTNEKVKKEVVANNNPEAIVRFAKELARETHLKSMYCTEVIRQMTRNESQKNISDVEMRAFQNIWNSIEVRTSIKTDWTKSIRTMAVWVINRENKFKNAKGDFFEGGKKLYADYLKSTGKWIDNSVFSHIKDEINTIHQIVHLVGGLDLPVIVKSNKIELERAWRIKPVTLSELYGGLSRMYPDKINFYQLIDKIHNASGYDTLTSLKLAKWFIMMDCYSVPEYHKKLWDMAPDPKEDFAYLRTDF